MKTVLQAQRWIEKYLQLAVSRHRVMRDPHTWSFQTSDPTGAESAIVWERKSNCEHAWSHHDNSGSDQTTVDWSVWQGILRCPVPVRLVVDHSGDGTYTHRALDVRKLKPREGTSGRKKTPAAWFRWSDFIDPAQRESDPAPSAANPNLLDFFR